MTLQSSLFRQRPRSSLSPTPLTARALTRSQRRFERRFSSQAVPLAASTTGTAEPSLLSFLRLPPLSDGRLSRRLYVLVPRPTGSGRPWCTRVDYKDLQFKIVEAAARLEAKDNHPIKCEVKSGNRGAAKIKWVIDNGTYVKPGDLLIDIDDSYLQDQATDAEDRPR